MSSSILDSVKQIEVIAEDTAKSIAVTSDNPKNIIQLEGLHRLISSTISSLENQNKLVGEMLTLVNTKIASIIASKQVAPSDVQKICRAIHAIAVQVLCEEKVPVLDQALPPELQGIALTYLSQRELKEQVELGLAGNEFKADAEVIKKVDPLTRIGDLLVKLPEKKGEVELWQKDKLPLADQIAMLEIYELDKLPDAKIHSAIAEGIQEGKTLTAEKKETPAAIVSKTLETIRKKLATVVTLDLNHKGLIYIPNAISLLVNLKILILRYNALIMVPDLSKNVQLTELDLGNNRLKVLPDLSKNVKLEMLILNSNQLTVAPDLSKNVHLKILCLNNNQLTVPPNVSKNVQLDTLYLNDNKLTSHPDLSKNIKLTSLDLSNTQLTTTPDITINSELKILRLNNNELTVAPNLSKNGKIRNLQIENNNLSSEEMKKLIKENPNISFLSC